MSAVRYPATRLSNTAMFRTKGVRAIYNSFAFSPDTLTPLLENTGERLFLNSEKIYESENSVSFKIFVDGEALFAKKFKVEKWYKRLHDYFDPSSDRCFRAGIKVSKAGVLTPAPLMSVAYRDGSGVQILVTDFINNAPSLNEYVLAKPPEERFALFTDLAEFLADYFSAGFYSQHLRSGNILVEEIESIPRFWMIDLDKLGSSRLLSSMRFSNMTARAIQEFYLDLDQEERQILTGECFKAALDRKIITDPEKGRIFYRKTDEDVKRRRA